jgi:hypothetical protein
MSTGEVAGLISGSPRRGTYQPEATLSSAKLAGGSVSERPKEHASKACEVQASVGSNPTATALATGKTPGRSVRPGPAFCS